MMLKPEGVDQTVWDDLSEKQKEWLVVHESLHENARKVLEEWEAALFAACDMVINDQLQ